MDMDMDDGGDADEIMIESRRAGEELAGGGQDVPVRGTHATYQG